LNPSRARIIISGYVQGVGYRFFACDRAQSLGIAGFVKNRPDGQVEVVAEGDKDILEDFISILKRGPSVASVNDVKVSWENSSGEFRSFNIRFS